MSGKARTTFLSLTITAVLILSAIGPTIAYADDGTPPETAAPESGGGDSAPPAARSARVIVGRAARR